MPVPLNLADFLSHSASLIIDQATPFCYILFFLQFNLVIRGALNRIHYYPDMWSSWCLSSGPHRIQFYYYFSETLRSILCYF